MKEPQKIIHEKIESWVTRNSRSQQAALADLADRYFSDNDTLPQGPNEETVISINDRGVELSVKRTYNQDNLP